MSSEFPAVVTRVGGKSRRLVLEKQWRRAVESRVLDRDTLIRYEIAPDHSRDCTAGECPELRAIFLEILGEEPEPPRPASIAEEAQPAAANPGPDAMPSRPVLPWPTAEIPKPALLSRARHVEDRAPVAPGASHPTTAWGWIVMPLRRYAEFSGRSSRAEYWWFLLAFTGANVLLTAIAPPAPADVPVLAMLLAMATFIPSLAVFVRRFHDHDISAWGIVVLALLALVPFVWIFILIAVFCILVTPGTRGPNKFGPDPRSYLV